MMRIISALIGAVALGAVGMGVWGRTTSVSAARYHDSFAVPDEDLQTRDAFVASRSTDEDGFARLIDIIAQTPRTTRLAGRPEEGHVSFVTRTRLMRFPDVTNVLRTEDGVAIRGQAVLGNGDMGVNRQRIEGWLRDAGLS